VSKAKRAQQAREYAIRRAERERRRVAGGRRAGEPDWSQVCLNCGASPVVPETGLCGPCTFGEAETSGGNW
jgi:hypothetical protein